MSIKVSGNLKPEEFRDIVEGASPGVECFTTYTLNGATIAKAGAGKYYLRINDRIGFYLFSASAGQEQRIDFSSVGGGAGLFSISRGIQGEL